MTSTHSDPRVAQALDLTERLSVILQRAERILRSTEARDIQRLDVVLRSLMQANHAMANAWNASLSLVPEAKPAPPKPTPTDPASLSPFFRSDIAQGGDTPQEYEQRLREAKRAAELNRPSEL